jgi:hypothetical protein
MLPLATAITVYMFPERSVSRFTSAASDLLLSSLQPKTSGKFYPFFVSVPGELVPSFSQFCLICFLLLPKVTYTRTSPFFPFFFRFCLPSLFLFQIVF